MKDIEQYTAEIMIQGVTPMDDIVQWDSHVKGIKLLDANISITNNIREVVGAHGYRTHVIPAKTIAHFEVKIPIEYYSKLLPFFVNDHRVCFAIGREKTVIEKLQTGTSPFIIYSMIGFIEDISAVYPDNYVELSIRGTAQ